MPARYLILIHGGTERQGTEMSQLTQIVRDRLERWNGAARVHDLYGLEGAELYERMVGPDRSEVREVLAAARTTEGEILDLAAGGGRLTIPLLRMGKRVTALDLSAEMLAHLLDATGSDPLLSVHIGDMSDFSLGRTFELILIGATSICLLDTDQRQGLYRAVRRHLAPGGRFSFSLTDESTATALSVTQSRVIEVGFATGPEKFLFAQQVVDAGTKRIVNFVRARDLEERADPVAVFASTLQILRPSQMIVELAEAGFAAVKISEVRTPTADAQHTIVFVEAVPAEEP